MSEGSEYILAKATVEMTCNNTAALLSQGNSIPIETAKVFVVSGRMDPYVNITLRYPLDEIEIEDLYLQLPWLSSIVRTSLNDRSLSVGNQSRPTNYLELRGYSSQDDIILIKWIQSIARDLV